MKLLIFLCILFAAGVLFQVYAHYNIMVSYKYEVDLTDTEIMLQSKGSVAEKKIRLEEIHQRKKELDHQQMITTILFWVCLGGFLSSLYLISRKSIQAAKASITDPD